MTRNTLEPRIRYEFGCVAAFDILGVRNLDIQKSRELLSKMLSFYNDHLNNNSTQLRTGEPIFQERPISKTPLLLGDTFIILYPANNRDIDHLGFLTCCAYYANQFFLSAIYNDIIMRGAMTIGDYLTVEGMSSVIGPAITDVIGWCEKADWIGWNLTPYCGLLFDTIQPDKQDPFNFTKYDMPISKKYGGQSYANLWCSAWPKVMVAHLEKTNDILEAKRKLITAMRKNDGIPMGVESKYFNTLNYFDHCIPTIKLNSDNPAKSGGGKPDKGDT